MNVSRLTSILRNWLERKKIYFETVIAASLASIAAILTAVSLFIGPSADSGQSNIQRKFMPSCIELLRTGLLDYRISNQCGDFDEIALRRHIRIYNLWIGDGSDSTCSFPLTLGAPSTNIRLTGKRNGLVGSIGIDHAPDPDAILRFIRSNQVAALSSFERRFGSASRVDLDVFTGITVYDAFLLNVRDRSGRSDIAFLSRGLDESGRINTFRVESELWTQMTAVVESARKAELVVKPSFVEPRIPEVVRQLVFRQEGFPCTPIGYTHAESGALDDEVPRPVSF